MKFSKKNLLLGIFILFFTSCLGYVFIGTHGAFWSSQEERYENVEMGIAFQYPKNVKVNTLEGVADIVGVADVGPSDTMHSFTITLFPDLVAKDTSSLRDVMLSEIIPNAYISSSSPVSDVEVSLAESVVGNMPVLTFVWPYGEGFITTNKKSQVIVVDIPYSFDPDTADSDKRKIQNSYRIVETLEML